VIPAANLATPVTASITVYNNAPGGTTSASLNFTVSNFAASLVFPHFAVGGGYATTLKLVNTEDLDSVATLTFTAPTGTPLVVRATRSTGEDLGTGSIMTITVPHGGMRTIILTDPAAGDIVKTGWVKVDCVKPLDGIVTFAKSQGSTLAALAGVLPATSSSKVVIPVYNSLLLNRQIGIAVANTSSVAISIRLIFTNTEGTIVDITAPPELTNLLPGNQVSKYLYELQPAISSFEGTVTLNTFIPGANFAAVALELNQNLMTVIPVIVK
jgi:hypothetical protein